MSLLKKIITGLVVGAATGAAVAIFLKSDKGKEFLGKAKDKADDVSKKLSKKTRQFKSEMDDLIEKGKDFVEDLEQKVKKTAGS